MKRIIPFFITLLILVVFASPLFAYSTWTLPENNDCQTQFENFKEELTRIYELAVKDRAASPDVLEDIRQLLYNKEKISDTFNH